MDRNSKTRSRTRSAAGRAPALRGVVALAVAALFALPVATTGAASVDELNAQISSAQQRAQGLGASIDAKTSQLAAAQQQAAAAAQRQAQLEGVLAQGEQRAAELQAQVEETQAHLQETRAHLRRSLRVLSERLVAIYKGDAPDEMGLLLSAKGFDDLANRAELVGRIEDSDAALAARVRALRDQVKAELAQVEDAKAKQDAINQRIAAARDQIASVRANAEAQAAQLAQARAEESAALSSLRSQVSTWEQQVQQAQQVSQAQAQETVSSWFGDWAIPQSIVQCESGGNFNAVNPSSGAGGAYQILPSTWSMYGGHGRPQDASPGEQSRIAGQIWADSGSSAWECAQ